ncbi:MAG: hypothetical protein IKE43_00465 [Coriobacteriales bacterium]|nr:hypothetical protein [Coriobacteriales bacterium]
MTISTIDPNAIDIANDLISDNDVEETSNEFGGGLTKEDSDRAIEENEDFIPYIGDASEDHTPQVTEDTRPAHVRTAELFDRMKPRRRELMKILALCTEPVDAADVHKAGNAMQAAHRSVYDGEALCNLLVRAGALQKIESEDRAPEVVVEDGIEYLKPAGKKSVQYCTTPVGQAVLDDDKPKERLFAALEKEPEYKPIFLRILLACAEDGGKTAKQLGDLVDKDELLQSPRRWAAYFFNILHECDALTWNTTWTTTELGMQGIEALELEGVMA